VQPRRTNKRVLYYICLDVPNTLAEGRMSGRFYKGVYRKIARDDEVKLNQQI
jgi:hypothetical protein